MCISKRIIRNTLLVIVAFVVLMWVANQLRDKLRFWDDDPTRGASAEGMTTADKFGDTYSKVTYPDQGWSASQSLWYYNVTQGSNLLPYDFFLALEQAGSQELFRSDTNMNHYRYLTQTVTSSNPDGLPVGMVKDRYQDKDYVGFTCSACHTSQVNYKGTAIRIDGGPTAADMVGYLKAMAAALKATNTSENKKKRFVNAVIALGNYDDEELIKADLARFSLRVDMYNYINHSDTDYGYARLDAFGRIYNRALENLLTEKQLEKLVSEVPGLNDQQKSHVMAGIKGVLTSENREEITRRTLAALIKNGKSEKQAIDTVVNSYRNKIFNSPDAPVSYPFLWDITQHDYVQWNGIGANAGLGPLGRNVGEVIGVFGTLDWHEVDKCSLPEVISGQCSLFGKKAKDQLIRFQSSADMRNLSLIEEQLSSLKSPKWDDEKLRDVLPPLNETQVKAGKKLFSEYCVACHQNIDRDNSYRKVVAFMADYKKVGTDPKVVENAVSYEGKSGFTKDLYVGLGNSALVIEDRMPVAALLTYATTGVVATPDTDRNVFLRSFDWVSSVYKSLTSNQIKASYKQGTYPPNTDKNPLASLQAYKGRPLNGIWATAPYLHNGSVPSLYDLLLPATCAVDDFACIKRPETFQVGSRELDAEKVGFKYEGYDGFTFDTRESGNSNMGHGYAAGKTSLPSGRLLPALNHEQRMALVEYMKSL